MVAALAAMVPGIGTAVAMADIAAETTGAYAGLDSLAGDKQVGDSEGDPDYDSSQVASAYHTGGMVHGKKDVNARLQPGEFVMRREAVKSVGDDNLRQMNALPNAGNLAGTSASPIPEAKSLGSTRQSRGTGGMGGGGQPGGLTSTVGAQSLSPDGSLTLKVHGFNNILAAFLQEKRLAVGQ